MPVNSAKGTTVNNPYQRDGVMAAGDNDAARVNYAPDSRGGPVADMQYAEPAYALKEATGRYEQSGRTNDDYVQATLFWHTIGADGQDRLVKTITTHMQTVPPPIRKRAVDIFMRVDPTFGKRMSENLIQDREPAVTARQ